jgi:hypothetical protein
MLQLRYATHGFWNCGTCGRRASAKVAKAIPAMKTTSNAVAGTTGVRVTAWDERTGRVNWGPSVAGGWDPQLGGIMHKPSGGPQRRRCGHSKRRSGRTIQPAGEPRATGPAVQVRNLRCRLDASPTTEQTPRMEIRTVAAYKPAPTRRRRWPLRQAGLKPYWGKPAVRNFRGGRGNEVDGLVTVCHDARKGGYVGSHWPNHVRASALLDVLCGYWRVSQLPPEARNPKQAQIGHSDLFRISGSTHRSRCRLSCLHHLSSAIGVQGLP